MLTAGSKAPDFNLPSGEMELRQLSDYKGKTVVVYFYPRDDTPGCTIQANEFTDLASEFADADAVVIGISPDTCFSHQQFRDKFGLEVTLLADTEHETAEAYGAWQEREKDGVKKMGMVRSTFVIDPEGIIRFVEYGVSPKGHAEKMLEFVRALKD